MKRLFIAIDLPNDVKQKLQNLLPELRPGLRPVLAEQMHITLHFLGDADPQAVTAALASVHFAPFTLHLTGAGRFNTHGKTVCWLGVDCCNDLTSLHAAVGRALSACGYQAEERRYKPHVSLLRAKKTVSNKTISEYLERLKQQTEIAFQVTEFCLYSSQLTPQGPCYTIEQRFK